MTSRPKICEVGFQINSSEHNDTDSPSGYRQNDKALYIKMKAALFMTSRRMSSSKRISFMAALNRVVTAKFIAQSRGRCKVLQRLDNGAIKARRNNNLNKPRNMTCKMIREENDRNIPQAPGASQNYSFIRLAAWPSLRQAEDDWR